MSQLLLLSSLIALGYALPNPFNPDCGPLCDYVHRPDPNYGWVGPIQTYDQDGYTTYILNMTSLTWFDEELSNRHIWWHYLAIHIPDEIRYTENAFLYVSSSNNNAGIPLPGSYHIYETGLYTNRTKMVTAVLRQIPNQPISFLGEAEERTEDTIVVWTWKRFLENEDAEPEILLHMPMTKAVSRAMDTITEFVQDMVPSVNVNEYMVAGESKRGWATWLLGASDRRVVAIVPELLSWLNFVENSHHYYQSLGGWPLMLMDYWNEEIFAWLDHPRLQDIMNLNDPYEFREYLTMPKLMISGSSDEFFMVDDYDYYFEELVGDKYIWLLENTGHTILSSPLYEDIWVMLEAFYISVIELDDYIFWVWLNNLVARYILFLFVVCLCWISANMKRQNSVNNVDYPRPVFSWTREFTETGGSITLSADQTPTLIEAWWAETPELVCERENDVCRRDFRKGVNRPPAPSPIEWYSMSVEDLGGNVYRAELDNAEDPNYYRPFYIKVHFAAPEDRQYIFTSQALIIPDGFPFEDCEGVNCQGELK